MTFLMSVFPMVMSKQNHRWKVLSLFDTFKKLKIYEKGVYEERFQSSR